MIKWIRWKVIFTICYIIITYIAFASWYREKMVSRFAVMDFFLRWVRVFVVIDFVLGCITLPIKYNQPDLTNFYFLCMYLVFLVVVFFMLGKLIKAFREDHKNESKI